MHHNIIFAQMLSTKEVQAAVTQPFESGFKSFEAPLVLQRPSRSWVVSVDARINLGEGEASQRNPNRSNDTVHLQG